VARQRAAVSQGAGLCRKRYYKPEWGVAWREHFSVGPHQRHASHELKCNNRKLVTTHMRVGFEADGSWRTFGLRKDFHPAVKIQYEDDITASIVVPPGILKTFLTLIATQRSNCGELRTVPVSAPDDAIHRGI